MNRREFLGVTGAAWLSPAIGDSGWPLDVRRAAADDIVIKGGRVIDPDQGIDRVLDVAIGSGRITAHGPGVLPDHQRQADWQPETHSTHRDCRRRPAATLGEWP